MRFPHRQENIFNETHILCGTRFLLIRFCLKIKIFYLSRLRIQQHSTEEKLILWGQSLNTTLSQNINKVFVFPSLWMGC